MKERFKSRDLASAEELLLSNMLEICKLLLDVGQKSLHLGGIRIRCRPQERGG
jgi:hypothetical protein